MSADTSAHDITPPHSPPSVRRRLAAFLYEGVLLFGLVVVVGLVFGIVTQQRHALQGHEALQAVLFATIGLYFCWFWTHGGQTLAMRTWHVRLVSADGHALSWPRAVWRYVLSYLWVLPALAADHLAGLKGVWPAFALLVANVFAVALAARLHPQRQFLHDAIAGTRLIHWQPALPAKSGR
jgi:uncharacterized RDD family membrane protein YckC